MKQKRRKIGVRISAIVLPLMVLSMVLLSVTYYFATKREMYNLSAGLLKQISTDTATLVQKEIRASAQTSEDVAKYVEAQGSADKNDILKALKVKQEEFGFKALGYADKKGMYTDTDGNTRDMSATSEFELAISGSRCASELYVSPISKETEIAYCAPITINGDIIGIVVAVKDGLEYSNITNALEIGYGGSAFILDRESGQILASNHEDLVKGLKTIDALSAENKEYQSFCEASKEMIENINGQTSYEINGQKQIVVYSGMLSDYWILGVSINEAAMLEGTRSLGYNLMFIAILIMIIAVSIVVIIIKDLNRGFGKLTGVIDEISTGNLTEKVDKKLMSRPDEIGAIASNVRHLNHNISGMLQGVKGAITDVSESSNELNKIANTLSENNASIVSVVTDIAQGNASQAQNLTDITVKLEAFDQLLNEMNGCITSISSVAEEISTDAVDSRSNMQDVTTTIETITDKFEVLIVMIEKMHERLDAITKITNLIEGISSKTNLLSLNASIESARAGEAGKGFNVVATEIGKLAMESNYSTKEIKEMIEEAIREMEVLTAESAEISGYIKEQNSSIKNAIDSFVSISSAIDEIQPIIGEVTEKAQYVEHDKRQILDAIDEIVAVSEQVSASAQEIVATTEEVASLSEGVAESTDQLVGSVGQMQEQIDQFKTE